MLSRLTTLLVPALLAASPIRMLAGECLSPDDWPQFRGPSALGVADGPAPPPSWDTSTSTNVAWRTAIPGLGLGSPIVCQGRVFVVTAVGADQSPSLKTGLYGDVESVADEGPQRWELYCLRRSTGQICWKRTLHYGVPRIKRHTKASHANSTPATDGRYVVVNLGSEGFYCLDLCGRLWWKKDLGLLDSGYYRSPDAQWGFGSSPIIFRNMAIVQADVQKDSFLAAFDLCSGREVWRSNRTDVPTWSTPTIMSGPRRTELVVNGYRHAGGYDPWTGRELWKVSQGGDIPVPTPIMAHGLIYLSSAHGSNRPLRAIRLGVTGDLSSKDSDDSSEHIAWSRPRDGIYMQTPLVYGPHLYACRNNGVLSCYDASTGERLYQQRIGGSTGFTASPVAAAGRIFFTNDDGDVFVVRAGAAYELLATNSMNEPCLATPAITNGMLIVRTTDAVYGIAERRGRRLQVVSASTGNESLRGPFVEH